VDEEHTTTAVQRHLNEMTGDSPAEPVVRAMLDRALRRLPRLCATLLYQGYPRLTRPPLNLQADKMLSEVVERLLKALREAHPATVRQHFGLACQHMRWELNDLARRVDQQPTPAGLSDGQVPAQASSASGLNPDGHWVLAAIDRLPEQEREAFNLVRIQGRSPGEAARVLGVSITMVKRRLSRGLQPLVVAFEDLRPGGGIVPGTFPSTAAGPHHDRRPANPVTARRTPRLARRYATRGGRCSPTVVFAVVLKPGCPLQRVFTHDGYCERV
jgi:RNA polymerase sigma-70 factor (ECF subfamily)